MVYPQSHQVLTVSKDWMMCQSSLQPNVSQLPRWKQLLHILPGPPMSKAQIGYGCKENGFWRQSAPPWISSTLSHQTEFQGWSPERIHRFLAWIALGLFIWRASIVICPILVFPITMFASLSSLLRKLRVIVTPGEMILPWILARVKEPLLSLYYWIYANYRAHNIKPN